MYFYLSTFYHNLKINYKWLIKPLLIAMQFLLTCIRYSKKTVFIVEKLYQKIDNKLLYIEK